MGIQKQRLAKLTIRPVPSFGYVDHRIVQLVQIGQDFRLEVSIPKGLGRWTVNLLADEVQNQLGILKRSTLPAFPVSPLALDGEHIELSIFGEHADFRFSWWTIAPEGADALDGFVGWLRSKIEHVDMGND